MNTRMRWKWKLIEFESSISSDNGKSIIFRFIMPSYNDYHRMNEGYRIFN